MHDDLIPSLVSSGRYTAMLCRLRHFRSSRRPSVVPPDAKAARQPEPWTKIPIPPLAPFTPVQPRRIELSNGIVILLEEDHELPFIYGSINMRGGGRDVPAAKTGLIGLYGETWRTSGTPTMNGDKLDDLLEAKAAKVETGGDIDSTSVSWSCLTKDEDQVFGIAVDLLEHPAFSDEKLKLGQAAGGRRHHQKK